MRLLLISFVLVFPCSLGQHLYCYHCMSQLSTEGSSKTEQNLMKTALFNRFNIPPSDEHCAVGGDGLLFRSTPKEKCEGVNDTCVRIMLAGDETKKLVLRGCQSTIYKPQFELVTNYSCSSSSSAFDCITTCQTPLCNTLTSKFHGFLVALFFVISSYFYV